MQNHPIHKLIVGTLVVFSLSVFSGGRASNSGLTILVPDRSIKDAYRLRLVDFDLVQVKTFASNEGLPALFSITYSTPLPPEAWKKRFPLKEGFEYTTLNWLYGGTAHFVDRIGDNALLKRLQRSNKDFFSSRADDRGEWLLELLQKIYQIRLVQPEFANLLEEYLVENGNAHKDEFRKSLNWIVSEAKVKQFANFETPFDPDYFYTIANNENRTVYISKAGWTNWFTQQLKSTNVNVYPLHELERTGLITHEVLGQIVKDQGDLNIDRAVTVNGLLYKQGGTPENINLAWSMLWQPKPLSEDHVFDDDDYTINSYLGQTFQLTMETTLPRNRGFLEYSHVADTTVDKRRQRVIFRIRTLNNQMHPRTVEPSEIFKITSIKSGEHFKDEIQEFLGTKSTMIDSTKGANLITAKSQTLEIQFLVATVVIDPIKDTIAFFKTSVRGFSKYISLSR